MTDSKCGCCCGSSKSTNQDNIKDAVKQKYGEIAELASAGRTPSCCGTDMGKDAITRDLYSVDETADLPEQAVLASMGCANPLALAELKPGEVVLDLGSGGGIDVLLSARRVGSTGKAYGLDMTDEMLALAEKNKAATGVENVEFIRGEIENIPLPDASVDVIISNCVINLSGDKDQVLREAFRVLKPGGRFAVADIVLVKPVSKTVQDNMALWAGCIAGALRNEEYIEKLGAAGFADAEVQVVKTYSLADVPGLIPDEIVEQIGQENIEEMVGSFVSAFVRASKPKACCCCS